MILTLRLLGLYALSGGVVTSYPIQVTQRYGMEPEPWSDYEE